VLLLVGGDKTAQVNMTQPSVAYEAVLHEEFRDPEEAAAHLNAA
jgi:hypothetical protein